MRISFLSVAVLSFLALLSGGCAVAKKENRLALNYLDQKVRPESTTGRAALAAPMVVAGTGALVADAVVVHPGRSVLPAAKDVYTFYWKKPAEMDTLNRSLLFVPCVVLTPPAFVVDWGLRCLFPLD